MKINNKEVIGDKFAYDGWHKIYVIEDEKDRKDAEEYDYQIFDLKDIQNVYKNSCELKFISNWKLDKRYVNQFEDVIFEYSNEVEI